MNSTRRIGFLLAIIFLLPALFFSVYEISSLNKDEKMIQEIYSKQLEAILFSVNQYSDDVLNSWISKIEIGRVEVKHTDSIPAKIKELLTFNSSLQLIFIVDTISETPVQHFYTLNDSIRTEHKNSIDSVLARNADQINELVTYKKSGFQKLGSLKYKSNSIDRQFLIFITNDPPKKFSLVGLVMNQEEFIQDMVGPRLQTIAKDKFILSAFDSVQTNPIYTTAATDSISSLNEAVTKDFWLFPDYKLGIRAQGNSLKDIVRERTTTNLILLLVLDIVLILGVLLVFRNVKNEVQLAQNKADFVSNVSHEIRTPLALISMFAETLEMGRVQSEEKKQEYYSILNKEAQRLSGIVNKILNFSQTEANKKLLHITSVQPETEIKDILKTYDFHLRDKGVACHFTPADNLTIRADKEAFTEIMINLIDNAIKYSDSKKLIEIATGVADSFGVIAIKDHGIGISKADLKHVFDKFYRVSSGNLAKSKGTGLGLTLVKQLVENQKGKITVTSELGKGSTFTVFFPLDK
jgi:two-component system, OmpR family, phosphate regulon sensor histidine kinase PhoR